MMIISVLARDIAKICAGVIAALTIANLAVQVLHHELGLGGLLGLWGLRRRLR
jgi:hypothetical protein